MGKILRMRAIKSTLQSTGFSLLSDLLNDSLADLTDVGPGTDTVVAFLLKHSAPVLASSGCNCYATALLQRVPPVPLPEAHDQECTDDD